MMKYIVIPTADFTTQHLNLSTSRSLSEVRKSIDETLSMIKSEYWYMDALNSFDQYDSVNIYALLSGPNWEPPPDEAVEESLGFVAKLKSRFLG